MIMRGLNGRSGAVDRALSRNTGTRKLARRWSLPCALLLAAVCAAQDEQGDMPDGTSGTTSGGTTSGGAAGAGGKASAGSAGSQAGTTGTAGANGGSSNA